MALKRPLTFASFLAGVAVLGWRLLGWIATEQDKGYYVPKDVR
ncbi:MAG TPA: hypothetical protein VNA68_03245 [Candidatus Dormibacteraeota bacterium]|nr:hypothetical protein [Candidatus Dormibacteraeota bacterium]